VNQICSSKSSRKGFWGLFITQFQVAFSDNVLKNLALFIILGLDIPLAEKEKIGAFIGALFALPFILFSMYGGFLADRFSKRTITINLKILEMAVLALVCGGLATDNRQILLGILLGGIFLMGTLAAFFGPSKYGLLPELLADNQLSWGNGMIEFGTYTAIILGTVAAGPLHHVFNGRQIWSGLILIVLAFAGLGTSLTITRLPAADPARKFRVNFFGDLFTQLNNARKDRPLALAFLGNAYFSFLGALLLLNVIFYGQVILHVDDIKISWLNAALALGIGAGSVAAGYASGGKIEHGLVPLGAFGISLVSMVLTAPHWSFNAALAWLALLGFAGGFFIVPVSAILQHRPAPSRKGAMLAAANWLSFVGIFLASGVYDLLAEILGWSPRAIFLFGGVLTFLGAIFVLILSPDSLVRAFLWMATHTVYRVSVEGQENLPRRGGVLLISNHVSFVDWLLVMSAADRPVRFLMGKEYYDKPWIQPLARVPRVIPIPPEIRPREVIQALNVCGRAIQTGDAVCIFAEGGITRTGQLQPFRRSFEHLMKMVLNGTGGQATLATNPAEEAAGPLPNPAIVPVALIGVWGSIFSFSGGKIFWKWPNQFPRRVTVRFGKALPPTATANEVQSAVESLMK
jgi:acyl-[acyl-carrier-protein]-phospholipid O-acyltransferase / long-chain-fatty-acid--[acyl-carrier-protein] ligase